MHPTAINRKVYLPIKLARSSDETTFLECVGLLHMETGELNLGLFGLDGSGFYVKVPAEVMSAIDHDTHNWPNTGLRIFL